MTLDEFLGPDRDTGPDPPVLKRLPGVHVPRDPITAGRAGWPVEHNRFGIGYATRRTRGGETYDDAVHYHVNTAGYLVSEHVLTHLATKPAPTTRVYVLESDTDTVYEYEFETFRTTTRIDYDEPQVGAPCADALHHWPGLGDTVWGEP